MPGADGARLGRIAIEDVRWQVYLGEGKAGMNATYRKLGRGCFVPGESLRERSWIGAESSDIILRDVLDSYGVSPRDRV